MLDIDFKKIHICPYFYRNSKKLNNDSVFYETVKRQKKLKKYSI